MATPSISSFYWCTFWSLHRSLRWAWGPCAGGDQSHHWARGSRVPLTVNASVYPPSAPVSAPAPPLSWFVPGEEHSPSYPTAGLSGRAQPLWGPPTPHSPLPTPPEAQFLLPAEPPGASTLRRRT